MSNKYISGSLKVNLDSKISDCGNDIDVLINESEDLEGLTSEQKNVISNIVHTSLLNQFSDFELNIFADEV